MIEKISAITEASLLFLTGLIASLLRFIFGIAQAVNSFGSPKLAADSIVESQAETAALENDKQRAANAKASAARLEADSTRRREALFVCDFFIIESVEKEHSSIWVCANDSAHGYYSFSLELDFDGSVSDGAEWPETFVRTLQAIEPEKTRASVFHAAQKAINHALAAPGPTPPVNPTTTNIVNLSKFNQGKTK